MSENDCETEASSLGQELDIPGIFWVGRDLYTFMESSSSRHQTPQYKPYRRMFGIRQLFEYIW